MALRETRPVKPNDSLSTSNGIMHSVFADLSSRMARDILPDAPTVYLLQRNARNLETKVDSGQPC